MNEHIRKALVMYRRTVRRFAVRAMPHAVAVDGVVIASGRLRDVEKR